MTRREIHITPDHTWVVCDQVAREKWMPAAITVEVRHPEPRGLSEINEWLKSRNKRAEMEIIPIQVLIEAYYMVVLANKD